jgi:hypothetical protein
MIKTTWCSLALLLSLMICGTFSAYASDQPADEFELRLERSSRSQGGTSTGSSNSRESLIERVLDVTADGILLEYNLPPQTTDEYRSRQWEFPVRVLKKRDRSLELSNVAELEDRVDDWLRRTDLDRSACGHWYFTWTVFQINCDPLSALEALEPFDLRLGPLGDGEMLFDHRALEPAVLQEVPTETGRRFRAEFALDPDVVRRENARSDVIVAELMSDGDIDFETAYEARSGESISGSLIVEIDTDDIGEVVRRSRVYRIETNYEDGTLEVVETTEVVTRTRVHSSMEN